MFIGIKSCADGRRPV